MLCRMRALCAPVRKLRERLRDRFSERARGYEMNARIRSGIERDCVRPLTSTEQGRMNSMRAY